MQVRQLLMRFLNRLRNRISARRTGYQPGVGPDGLIVQDAQWEKPIPQSATGANQVILKPVAAQGPKPESIEKLQQGFDKLIDHLQDINIHLDKQFDQHQQLISRIDQMPKLLESFPAVVENQKQLTEQLFGQLKANVIKDQQLLEAIEKIPAEAARQTDVLDSIDHQLAAAADSDVQMAETFNKFNETLGVLNEKTTANTDGLSQMSRTFAASDRYLKYIVAKQNRLLMWVFISAVSVCLAVILILVGIVIYLGR